MNKSAGLLLGFVVVVGAVSSVGAWYTGNQLEGVLNTSIQDANQQLKTALASTGGSANVELVSLDRHLFSSTAHYRVKLQNLQAGEQKKDIELLFVDHIEHGPLPWSRLKALKLAPVMVYSNYELEKSDTTAPWFDAAKGAAPLKGQLALGYNRSVEGNIELVPLDFAPDATTHLKFSGLSLAVSASDQAAKIKLNGYMDNLKVSAVSPEQGPVQVELNGLTLASDLAKSGLGFYLGQNILELSETKVTYGVKPAVVTIKGFEQKDSTEAQGNVLSGRVAYNVASIDYNDKPVGSAQMSWTAKNLDFPAMQSLIKLYQVQLEALQKAQAAGAPDPEAAVPELTPAQQTQAEADIKQLLAGKPQIALENFSFKTANGESRASLLVDLTNPSSTELPPMELGKQLVSQLDAKVLLSKPMISDLAGLQAQIQGQNDPKAVAQQASTASEMAGTMALSTEMATVQGNDIVSALHYAGGQVDFNGQKMPVEDFITLLLTKFGGQGGEQP
ncbi:YdgA family protein [Pseudomonas batumici]|uniref:YdgA family protein n=1 Tax=Pseudomonas batumici TaxID=226910 RepID=UPI0030CD1D96